MWTVESNQKLSQVGLFSSLSYKKIQNSYLDFILLKFLPKARCCIDLFLLSHTIKVERSDSIPGKNQSEKGHNKETRDTTVTACAAHPALQASCQSASLPSQGWKRPLQRLL